MSDRTKHSLQRWIRFSLVAGSVAAGLSVMVTDAAHAEVGAIPTRDITAVPLIAEDAGWRPGETPVPGKFPNAQVVDDLGARRIHYVDAAGVKRTSVLVFMDPAISKRAAQRTNVRALAAKKGGVVRYEYGATMPGVLNLRDIPESAVEALKKMPGVLKVERDEYHANVVRLTKSTPLIRGLQSQITGAGLSADGAGVRVCVCDTGIDMDHVMYSSRIDAAASWDFANNDSNPDDDHGHGSHVSGIAVGGTGLSFDLGCGSVPFQGVAPAATLIGAKILNSSGGGTDSDIIAGIDHCADQTASGGRADVINLSIGTGNYSGTCTHSWAVAANNAVANGVVVVAASGNECNTNSMGSPACGVDVIAVGATYKDNYPNCEDSTSSFNWCGSPQTNIGVDDIVDFSNQSDFLDVTAPGSVIWSASNSAGGGSVTSMSGTSMSSPHVAGLAALIIGVDPTLTPAEVRQVIRDGAIDMGPVGFDLGYGYGRIDVIGSLQQLTPCTGNPDCDDGLWCNGSETCSGGSCLAGSDPCPGQSCDEATDTCVAAPTLQYEWNMNTDPGWTTQGLWAYGQPTGGGGQYGGPDPTSGATGNNVYGYNLSGDYESSLAETHLTTGAIDCSTLAEVSVEFQRWLGVETSTYDHAYFRISTNGSTWTTLWSNGGEVADTSWGLQSFDISAIADGQATVYLRWTMGTTDGSWQYCGWNIDDVQIWGRGPGGGCSVPADCDDGLWCNGAEDCVGGTCVAGTAPNCNDGVACTDDSCNEGTASCDNVANDANCDNGLWCDGAETCNATLDCQTGTAPNCNDGVACTDDSCNEGTASCDNVANDANCDNGLWCDGAETCNSTLDCQAGTPPTCDDGVGCTDDSCNAGTNSCDNVANDGNCDDGQACNGAETCHATNDCQAGTVVDCNDGVGCTTDACNEPGGTCSNTPDDGACDDGLACNGAETCHATNDCQAGTAVDCNDGVGCTTDSCNEPGGTCSNAPSDAACDDALYCNGAERCDTALDCQAGTAVDCNDGVGCTDDSCNEGTDSCNNVANDANCDDALFCNGAETCDAGLDCQVGTDPCPGLGCDEGTDTCVSCLGDGDCDDGVACNGTETCVGGNCQAGTAVNCDDGIACTTDTCNDPSGTCSNTPSDAACDDGLACNGAEWCDAALDCQSGTAVDCNDGVGCTTDSCNDPGGTCSNAPSDAACDDGLYCNGAETCDTVFDCQAGTAVDCNDGVACTDDSCNNTTSSCDNVANDANCPDDLLFCTGTEYCDTALDCSSTGDPCGASTTCNETTDTCDSTGPPPGEGYILSKNADFSTNDLTFFRTETIYMKVWSDVVDFNDLRKSEWELRDNLGNKVKQNLTNHFDSTYTAQYSLANLPSAELDWEWRGKAEDNPGNRYRPTDFIQVLDAPACGVNADCDDADACTTDVCSAGTCSNTPINCDDGDACTADSCSGGVCVNDPLPTCCGDTFCDAGEDVCNCPADCGAPPGSETNCTDGIDEDCDGNTDCADADCSGDPACAGPPPGEGYILSLNPDFSTDDRVFTRSDIIYMKMWTDQVDFNDMNRERWELKDPNKNKVRQPLTNHFDGTWTAAYDLANLPSNDTDWTWKGEVRDNADVQYKPSDTITVNP